MDGALNSYKLDGQVAVVTGAARGIGACTATRLAELGAQVVLTGKGKNVEDTAAGLRSRGLDATAWQMDVRDSHEVDEASREIARQYKKINILVANAGIAYEAAAIDHTDEQWRDVMAVNLDGVFYCARAFGRVMMEGGSGTIIAIASAAGIKSVRPEVHIGYDVSKAAVAHFCRMLGVEWAKFNIRVNAVAPGHTRTEILQRVGTSNPERVKTWLEDIPIGRFIEPEEVANVVAFLASPAASGITAQILPVDGGYCSA